MRTEPELQLLVESWSKSKAEPRKHVSTQLREEVIEHLRLGEPLPPPLAEWLADALDSKNLELFAEPWKKLLPGKNRYRTLEMAIMARILKNRPDLRGGKRGRVHGFLEAAADLFEVPVKAVEQAHNEYRELLEFLEERMGMKHLPTKGDILAYRDRELEQVAEALDEALRDKQQLASVIAECLKRPPDHR